MQRTGQTLPCQAPSRPSYVPRHPSLNRRCNTSRCLPYSPLFQPRAVFCMYGTLVMHPAAGGTISLCLVPPSPDPKRNVWEIIFKDRLGSTNVCFC